MPSFEINPNAKKGTERDNKLVKRADAGGVEGRTAAKMLQKKGKGPSLPGRTQDMKKVAQEEIVPGLKIVDIILGEQKCGKGMYYCYTDKKCKKIPEGLKMTSRYLGGDSKEPEEVGIDKPLQGGSGNGSGGGEVGEGLSIEDAFGNKFLEVVDLIKPDEIVEKCWTGYTQKGLKKKGKKMVPNCVPVGEEKDHEVSMAQSQLDKSAKNIKDLKKKLGTKEKNIPAWVQAKITDTEHNTDAAAGYTKKEEVEMQEAVRLPAEFGHIMAVVVMWRGKSYHIRMFFPQAKMPTKKEAQLEIEKVYPGGKVLSVVRSDLPSQFAPINSPLFKVQKEEKEAGCPKCAGKCGKGCECECHHDKEEVDEAKGEKDACYKKVKSRYKVWPSAYASGALVKCRQKGADNWGNSTKEEFEYELKEEWVATTAAQYFIEQGLNEEGVAILTEEMGLDDFVDFVFDLGEETMLTEARAGGVRVEPVTAKGKSFAKGKPTGKSLERLRRLKAERKEAEAKASAAKPSGMKAALQSQSKTAKKRDQAVRSAKSQQPKKRGILDKVAKQVLKGIDRHNAAMAKAKSDIKTTKKLAGETGKTIAKAAAVTHEAGRRAGESKVGQAVKKAGGAAIKAGVAKAKKDIESLKVKKEEVDRLGKSEVSEKMNLAKADMGDVIKDFRKSDAPQFKGKSDKKIRQMAIAAKLEAERGEQKEDWQKVNRKDKTDGLSQKAVNAYRKENPGSKLKTAVTTKPSKIKKGSKDAKRRSSFCSRMKGMKKRLTSAETARDPDSRINKALRRWNCN